MFARARELAAQREAERQRVVAELEEKRWRASSDVLRARESKIRVLTTTADRGAQLVEKDRAEADRVRSPPPPACPSATLRGLV